MITDIRKKIVGLAILTAVAGIWLLISPFALSFPDLSQAMRNDVGFGIIVAFLAAIYASLPERATWLSWLNCLLGLWVVMSPWVLSFSTDASATWNNVITGVIIVALSAGAAIMGEERFHHPTTS